MTEIIELNCYCTNCEHKEILKTHGVIELASISCPICKQPMRISVKTDMKNDLDYLTDKIDFEQIIRMLIGLILFVTTVSIVIFGMIPLMEKTVNEIKAYEAMTPQERAQYEKESKQQRYEEKIDIYVDTETGIEYLIYKDYHYGIGGGNDVIIPRYDEYGNVKTNSTYLELK